MDKWNAVWELMRDRNNLRPSRTSFLRVMKAINTLGFSAEERQRCLFMFGYVDHNGSLFLRFQPREKPCQRAKA